LAVGFKSIPDTNNEYPEFFFARSLVVNAMAKDIAIFSPSIIKTEETSFNLKTLNIGRITPRIIS